MAEPYFQLSAQDQSDALAIAAQRLGRPQVLIEKDIWVVWALQALFDARAPEGLVFKGGTSLSKVFGLIDRFSEDIDLTYDVRRLLPDMTSGRALAASRTEAAKWSDAVRRALPDWLRSELLPSLERAASDIDGLTLEHRNDTILVAYPGRSRTDSYVAPRVLLEFGARSTGEPFQRQTIGCDAGAAIGESVSFPSATVRALVPERTFWEKATAIHAYCVRGTFRGGARWSRHWYDVVALAAAGVAERAATDRGLRVAVAAHKRQFFHEPGVDYAAAVEGNLRLVPPKGASRDALEADFSSMRTAGMFLVDPPSFTELLAQVDQIERRVNQLAAF